MEVARKKILIVEDEAPMLKILSDTLQSHGFSAIGAKDGEEGLKAAKIEQPDLILLDLLMPKVDGITMMIKLREAEWGKNVPIIILTNVNPDSDTTMKAVVENQPAYYLIKSDYKIEDIIEKIKEVLATSSNPSRQVSS